MNKKWLLLFAAMIVLSAVLHYKNFSKDLMGKHVWRQALTQSIIDNFYTEDMNILNPRQNERFNGNGIFRMEFPLMQWVVAVSYKVFGQHLLITRIWMFITGLFTVAGMYKLLLSIFDNNVLAMMGAWAFCWSPAFFYYTINPLPDNLALCLIVWSIALFFSWISTHKNTTLIYAGILLSLGTLVKLPFIVYYAIPFVYMLMQLKTNGFSKTFVVNSLAIFGFILLPVVWYASVIAGWSGNGIVQGVLSSNTSVPVIAGYILYHLYSTLPELLLNYAAVSFFIAGFYFFIKRKAFADKRAAMFIVCGLFVTAYFLFEINMIEKVHDYYFSILSFPVCVGWLWCLPSLSTH